MKKYNILVCLTIIILSACTDSRPKEVLDKHQMSSMLIDMYVKEAQLDEFGVSTDSMKILYQLALKQVLETKGISEETYLKSYDYYMANLKKFDEVYSIVIDSLKYRESVAQQRALADAEAMENSPQDDEVLSMYSVGPNLPALDSSLYLLPFDSVPPIKIDSLSSSIRSDSLPLVDPKI